MQFSKLFYNQPQLLTTENEEVCVAVEPIEKELTPADYDRFSERIGITITSQPQAPKEETKPIIDLSGIVLGATVRHKKFGDGKIILFDTNDNKVKIKFDVGEKTFRFPTAFLDGFFDL